MLQWAAHLSAAKDIRTVSFGKPCSLQGIGCEVQCPQVEKIIGSLYVCRSHLQLSNSGATMLHAVWALSAPYASFYTKEFSEWANLSFKPLNEKKKTIVQIQLMLYIR